MCCLHLFLFPHYIWRKAGWPAQQQRSMQKTLKVKQEGWHSLFWFKAFKWGETLKLFQWVNIVADKNLHLISNLNLTKSFSILPLLSMLSFILILQSCGIMLSVTAAGMVFTFTGTPVHSQIGGMFFLPEPLWSAWRSDHRMHSTVLFLLPVLPR